MHETIHLDNFMTERRSDQPTSERNPSLIIETSVSMPSYQMDRLNLQLFLWRSLAGLAAVGALYETGLVEFFLKH